MFINPLLTYSQFCKSPITLQPDKQGLFSLIPKAAVHMNFAVNFARFFRTPILHNIIIYKVVVLKNLAKFKRKYLCWILFLLKCRPQTCNFIKRTLQHRCFPVNFEKFPGTPLRDCLSNTVQISLHQYIFGLSILSNTYLGRS